MLSGFNTNIRHRGVLFHVQSEDSGRANPHIITHVYYGGTILASEKSSYEDRLEDDGLTAVVKSLMEDQHKNVLSRLVAGEFDALILERLGASIFEDDSPDDPSLDPSDSGASPSMAREPVRGSENAASPGPNETTAPSREPNAWGPSRREESISERPLDEVILAHLVESARQRQRQSK